LPGKRQKECSSQAALIYNAQSKQEAIKQFKVWKRKWIKVSEKAADCFAIFNRLNKHWKEHPFRRFNQLQETSL